ncbi:hypothetical protein [Gemmatimonas sp.]|uniref:hypothetical protein n=1 Tax=Gemmatimonas sp. TaxID=1962908 RepID=UPI0033426BF8
MPYNGGIATHSRKVQVRHKQVFGGLTSELGRSIRDGSELTGAPGQPRRTSNLYFSWIDRFLAPFRWQIATNVSYAPFVEDAVRGQRFRNGGPHSLKLTILGANRVLAAVLERFRNA